MRAAVVQNRTERTIRLEVSEVPDIDVTASYHRKPRVFRPENVLIKIVDGDLDKVQVSGGLVLKSGNVSDAVGEHREWHAGTGGYSSGGHLSKAPEWVQLIAERAPLGVTNYGGQP
jgi:hypothetical protein